jgi:hypothetical protein
MGWGGKWCVHCFRLIVNDDGVDNESRKLESWSRAA